jgi:hypothetical protein
VNERDSDSHDVWFGKRGEGYCQMLPRGTLRKLATSSLAHVRTTLNTLSKGTITPYLETHMIPLFDLALAFAQARIKALEDGVGEHILEAGQTLEYLGAPIPADPDEGCF